MQFLLISKIDPFSTLNDVAVHLTGE